MALKTFEERTSVVGECLEWTGRVNDQGYGIVYRDRRGVRAHRVAWELAHGAIPVGLCVLHHCDNRRCVKTKGDEKWPDGHLFLGTKADNTHDMLAKGRHVYRPKVTEAQVRALLARMANAEDRHGLAREFGLSVSYLTALARGETWRHIPRPIIPSMLLRGERAARARMTADQVRDIRGRWAQGATITELSRQFGIRRSSVGGIVTGKNWRHIL